MYMTRKLYEASSGDLLVTMGNVAFLRGDGGFGGKSEGAPKPRPVPADRPPDLQATLPVDAQPGAHLSACRRLQPVAHRSRHCAQRRLRSADSARARAHTAWSGRALDQGAVRRRSGDGCAASTCASRVPSIPASRCTWTSGTSARAMRRSVWSRASATSSSRTSVASSTKPSAHHHVHRLRRHHDHHRLRSSGAVRRDDEGPHPRAPARRANHRRHARSAGVLAGGGGVLAGARVRVLSRRARCTSRSSIRASAPSATSSSVVADGHAFLAPDNGLLAPDRGAQRLGLRSTGSTPPQAIARFKLPRAERHLPWSRHFCADRGGARGRPGRAGGSGTEDHRYRAVLGRRADGRRRPGRRRGHHHRPLRQPDHQHRRRR